MIDTTRLTARAMLTLAASGDRDARTTVFAAALLALWRRYRRGDLSRADFEAAARDLVSQSVADVVDAYAAENDEDTRTVMAAASHLGYAKALAGLMLAAFAGLALFSPGAEAPSDATAEAVANRAAGGLWALEFVVEAAAKGGMGTATWRCVDDDRSCEDCLNLDGQSWSVDQIPQWPGGGETQCLGNCRCELEFS